jgi:large conductance mechanosensitive channel
MSFISEFKQFAMKGNVVDLAVGVIIGAAFGKIVSSLVENVIMPPLGLALSGVNFADLAVTLALDPAGKPVLLRYGAFLQSIFDFLVIAVVIFMAIKAINRIQAAPAAEPPAAAPAPAEPPRQEALLEEIRDLLKQSR